MTRNTGFIVAALLIAGVTDSHAQEIKVCMGQYPENSGLCIAHDAFTPCGTIESFAKTYCQRRGASGEFDLIVMRSVGGNHCGYSNYLVVCK